MELFGARIPEYFRVDVQLFIDFEFFLLIFKLHCVDIAISGFPPTSHRYSPSNVAIRLSKWLISRRRFLQSSGSFTFPWELQANDDTVN